MAGRLPETSAARATAVGPLAVAVAVAACKPGLPPGWDADASYEFQVASDAAMGESVSPLTAVDAFYFGEQTPLGLAVVAGAVAASSEPMIVLSTDDDGVHCTAGCSVQGEGVVSSPIPLPPFVLAVGLQAGGGRVVVHDPRRRPPAGFAGSRWFDVTPEFIVAARFVPSEDSPTVSLATTRGLSKPFVRVGRLDFLLQGRPQRLFAFGSGGQPDAQWLVPFTDPTNGASSYHVGRYLEVEPPASGRDVVALDFNRATSPWCAYSPHYNCPVPPPENRLQAPIEAGEQHSLHPLQK